MKCEIPCFVHIIDGTVHDVNTLDIIEFEADAFYHIDRGYFDWSRLHNRHLAGAYFAIRTKDNLAFVQIFLKR